MSSKKLFGETSFLPVLSKRQKLQKILKEEEIMKNLLAICFALLAFSGLAAFGNKSAIGVIAVAVYPEAKRYEPPPPPCRLYLCRKKAANWRLNKQWKCGIGRQHFTRFWT